MVKVIFAKTGKSYLNLLDWHANFLDYCANLPRNTGTQSKPCTKYIHIETNYTATQCIMQFLHKWKSSSNGFYFFVKLH